MAGHRRVCTALRGLSSLRAPFSQNRIARVTLSAGDRLWSGASTVARIWGVLGGVAAVVGLLGSLVGLGYLSWPNGGPKPRSTLEFCMSASGAVGRG